MKTVLFYFTGTGNNYHVAKRIQESLDGAELYPLHILEKNHDLVNRYDRIIYCVPVYYSHIPPYVKEVLNGIEYKDSKQIISILGCGGNRGHAIEDIRECVNGKNQIVSGEYMLMMPGNYILSYNAFPKFYQTITCHFADKKVDRIINAIKSNQLTTLKKTGIIYKEKYEPRLKQAMSSFSKIGQQYVVSEKCIGCGLCAKVCPVENIKLIDKKPQFSDRCQQCMACVQWCPNKCIDHDNKAKGRKRYHHRDVTINDLIKMQSQ